LTAKQVSPAPAGRAAVPAAGAFQYFQCFKRLQATQRKTSVAFKDNEKHNQNQ
jgi:hypothetical protein